MTSNSAIEKESLISSSSSNAESSEAPPSTYYDNYNKSPTKSQQQQQYKLYPKRHVVLLSFSILTCVNAWMWITWSPISTLLPSYWSASSSETLSTSSIDELSSIYMYIYIPLSFPALHLLHILKLRYGLLLGAFLNALGAVIRYTCITNYKLVYAGTLCCAIAQTLTLSIPPLLSGLWYGAHERGVATSVGVVANQCGTALGLGGTLFLNLTMTRIVKSQQQEEVVREEEVVNEVVLKYYVGIQMVISIVAFIMIYMFVENHPPTPPSEAIAYAEWDFDDPSEENCKNDDNDEDGDEEAKSSIVKNGDDKELSERNGIQHHMPYQATETSSSSSSNESNGTVPSLLMYNSNALHREQQQQRPILSPENNHSHHHEQTPTYLSSISKLLTFQSGILLTIFYGSVVGVFYAIETFLSQFILFKGKDDVWTSREAGLLGLVLVIMGCLGSILSGYELDRSSGSRGDDNNEKGRGKEEAPKHKEITMLYTIGSIVSMMIFTISILYNGGSAHQFVVYIIISCLGFFLSGVTLIGFEYASAITYPADEAAVAGVLNVAAQIGGWMLLILGGRLGEDGIVGVDDGIVSSGGGVGLKFNIVLVGTLILSAMLLMVGVTDKSQRPTHKQITLNF